MKAFFVSGTHSGVGKTTLSLGLMRAFRRQGKKVKPFKVGPDYIDTGYHHIAAGAKSINLDAHLLTEDGIRSIFRKQSQGIDLAIIEGVMGLYDGKSVQDDFASTAHMAHILGEKVLLVVDAKGMALSAAAMISGFEKFKYAPSFLGVIFNGVKSLHHYVLLKEGVEAHTSLRCFGYVPPFEGIRTPSRHLGLQTVHENQDIDAAIEAFAVHLEKSVSLEEIWAALQEKPLPAVGEQALTFEKRMAYAYDEAFQFYYEDNLDFLKEHHILPVPFSPLRDKKLPENIQGLYIGGGYPELYAQALSRNESMKKDIREKLSAGLFCYAECGGMMYLTEGFTDREGIFHSWVGFLEGKCHLKDRLQQFGYVSVCTPGGLCFPAHSFHYSACESSQNHYFTVQKKEKSHAEGFYQNRTVALYPHVYFRGAEGFFDWLMAHMG